MYPIRFEPIYKNFVWGGGRIAAEYHRKVDLPRVGESWEISDRKEAESLVANGPFKGTTLNQLVKEHGEALLGLTRQFGRFPLLLKIIDAKENLGIQVHPDESSAPALKGEPKSEMWFMLEPGSIYAGLKKEVGEKEFLKALKAQKVEESLEKLDLKKGEAVYIPGGRIHSICAGSFLYEIQQNSDTNYLLYDWGRKNSELNIEQGLAAVHWHDHSNSKLTLRHISSDLHHQFIGIVDSPFFAVDRIDVFDRHHIAAIPKTFQVFFFIEGEGQVSANSHTESFQSGMTYLIPAAAKGIEIQGRCQFLRIRLP